MKITTLKLASPPENNRDFEYWLPHAAGRILVNDVRDYAVGRLDPSLSVETRSAATKAINDALYGVTMILDGVTGAIDNETHRVEIVAQVRLIDRKSDQVLKQMDLFDSDGLCMAYHGWLEGDYGELPVATEEPL